MSQAPLLSLSEVSFEYQLKGSSFQALHNITLRINAGEFVAIIGPSGSGKSTLMNILGLMSQPHTGAVRVEGREVKSLTADDLGLLRNKKIGFIFQHFHLLPRLSVLENILLPASYASIQKKQASRANALRLLENFGMTDQMHKKPAALSGGQKQRVAICRALLLDPDFILADEPTGALDSRNSQAVLDILERLNRDSGKTIVIITHDPAVAARARRIVRLDDGQITSDLCPNRLELPLLQSLEAHSTPLSTFSPSSSFSRTGDKVVANKAKWEGIGFGFGHGLTATLRQSLDSLAANKVRSLLTIFGLMIGVLSIIIMITLTAEARVVFRRFFDTKGGNNGAIYFDGREAERTGAPRWRGFHVERELVRVNSFFEKHGRIEPILGASGCAVKSASRTFKHDISGVSAVETFSENEMRLAKGRYFSPSEVAHAANGKVTLLGSDTVEKLFPQTDPGYAAQASYPVGEIVSVSGCAFSGSLRIVGVLEKQDTTFDSELNNNLYVPSKTLIANGLQAFQTSLTVVPNTGVSSTWLTESVKNYISLQTNQKFPLRSFVPEQQIAKINMMLSILGALTVVIGTLCIIIGGVGVMNIMLVNIAERIREIGIRKAVGARSSHIRNQFLVESTALCLVSGVMGAFFGILISNTVVILAAYFLPRYLESHFLFNTGAITLGLGSSLLAGVCFGLLPAKRAASLDVALALKQE